MATSGRAPPSAWLHNRRPVGHVALRGVEHPDDEVPLVLAAGEPGEEEHEQSEFCRSLANSTSGTFLPVFMNIATDLHHVVRTAPGASRTTLAERTVRRSTLKGLESSHCPVRSGGQFACELVAAGQLHQQFHQ